VKEALLQAVEEGRSREAELAAGVVDQPAAADGTWSAKDHLAHLSWWRRRTVRTLEAVRTGAELPPPVADDDDVQNAIVYAEVKDRAAADVLADARDSWSALWTAIEESSEDELARSHPREPESQLWESVPGAVGHAGTHIWSWLLDAGDEKRAMDVARWSAEMEGRFFTTPVQLADSRYNLACVFARLGDAQQALPLLRESFQAKPELAALARKDRDLDRIREELAPILF
jgi:DinB superfamily